MKKKWLKWIGYALLAALLLIQFIKIDKTNPVIIPEQDFIQTMNPPQEVAVMLKSACYDCHSHNTTYPWYSNIAPVSFFLRGHIVGGRKHLNFSTWSLYDQKKQNHKIEEIIEEVEEGNMPLSSYVWLHSEAKMSVQDKDEFVQYFKTLK